MYIDPTIRGTQSDRRLDPDRKMPSKHSDLRRCLDEFDGIEASRKAARLVDQTKRETDRNPVNGFRNQARLVPLTLTSHHGEVEEPVRRSKSHQNAEESVPLRECWMNVIAT